MSFESVILTPTQVTNKLITIIRVFLAFNELYINELYCMFSFMTALFSSAHSFED